MCVYIYFRGTKHQLIVSRHQIPRTRGLAGCLKLACKRMRHHDFCRMRVSFKLVMGILTGDFDSPKSGVNEIYRGSRPLNEAIGQSGWPYESVSRAERDVLLLGWTAFWICQTMEYPQIHWWLPMIPMARWATTASSMLARKRAASAERCPDGDPEMGATTPMQNSQRLK